MTIYQFMGDHPILTFFLTYMSLSICVEYPLKIINRWIRHRNIIKCGWPPPHLDADGDWRPDKAEQGDDE